MGGHYGSIHIRSSDRDSLLKQVTAFAAERQLHLLVGPAINEWVAIYPEHHGQDDRVSAQLAGAVGGEVLHLMVHDDDIFAYWLYRDGRCVDSFYSSPGYFGEENRAAQEAMRGDPEMFRPLIGDRVDRLAPLLDRDDQPLMANESMQAFSKVLGIANAVQAYEYLKEGERIGLKGWRQFVEIPESQVKVENSKKDAERRAERGALQKFATQGLLLHNDERKMVQPVGCALNDRYLVAWSDYRTQSVSLDEYRSPWKKPHPIELQSPALINGLATDVQGHRLAIAAGKCVCVFDIDRDGLQPAVEINESDHAVGVAMSADGDVVAHASRQELVFTNARDGTRLGQLSGQVGSAIAIHPNGVVAAVGGATLGLIRISSTPQRTDLYVGGKVDDNAISARLLQPQLAKMDIDGMRAQQQATVETAVKKFEKMASKMKLPPEELEKFRQTMQAKTSAMLDQFEQMKAGNFPPSPPRGRERVQCVGFSHDGSWMWCGTDVGLRVYRWNDLQRGEVFELPSPMWKFTLPGEVQFEFSRSVSAIAEEINNPAIVFGGGTSRLYCLDLHTGETRELLLLPGNARIAALAMAKDGRTLGIASHSTDQLTRGGLQRCAWSIWSYPLPRGPVASSEQDGRS